jgi:hypothetical protein
MPHHSTTIERLEVLGCQSESERKVISILRGEKSKFEMSAKYLFYHSGLSKVD